MSSTTKQLRGFYDRKGVKWNLPTEAGTEVPSVEIAEIEQSLAGKVDVIEDPTLAAGNFASINSKGGIANSGKKASDFATPSDVAEKISNVTNPTVGNFPKLKADGTLEDSGKSDSDFISKMDSTHASYAENLLIVSDANGGVTYSRRSLSSVASNTTTDALATRISSLERYVAALRNNLYTGADIYKKYTAGSTSVHASIRIIQNIEAGIYNFSATESGFPSTVSDEALRGTCLIFMKTGKNPVVDQTDLYLYGSDGSASDVLAIKSWSAETVTLEESSDVFLAFVVDGYAEYLKTHTVNEVPTYSTSGTLSVKDILIQRVEESTEE